MSLKIDWKKSNQMQILLIILLFLFLLVFLIFKIRNRFKIRELLIFIAIIFSFSFLAYYYLVKEENKVPNLFKTKYENKFNTLIKKFSYSRVNNIYLSSDKIFLYNFNYIIDKDGIEQFCSVKNQKIIKIEDEYIFEKFDDLKEECEKR